MNLQSYILLIMVLALALTAGVYHVRKSRKGGGCSHCSCNCPVKAIRKKG